MPADQQPLNLARIVFQLMTQPRGWDVENLKETLGIADRTFRKYRKNLQDLFDPWFHNGRTRLVEEEIGGRKYLRLSEPSEPNEAVESLILQQAALHFSSQLLGYLGDDDLGQSLLGAAEAFGAEGRRAYPMTFTRVLTNLDRLFVHVADAPKSYAGQERKLRELIRALVFNHPVAFRYDAANGTSADREVQPLSLVLFRGGLHLFARFEGGGKTYNFAVDRIHEPRALARDLPYPSADDYDPHALLTGAFGIFIAGEDAEPRTVDLVFDDVKWLKFHVRERLWHPRQRLEDLDDGRLRLSFEVTTLVEVVPWVRQFGEEVEVLGPPELIDRLEPSGERST